VESKEGRLGKARVKGRERERVEERGGRGVDGRRKGNKTVARREVTFILYSSYLGDMVARSVHSLSAER
jgi:hypothetical protein